MKKEAGRLLLVLVLIVAIIMAFFIIKKLPQPHIIENLEEETICEINVSQCGNLNQAGKVYCLNRSVSSSPNQHCLIVSADNIIFDGRGYNLNNNRSWDANYHGLFASDRHNITIKNFNISNFENGIYFTSTSNSFLYNNEVSGAMFAISFWSDSNNNTIHGNTLNKDYQGIIFILSKDNKVINNKLYFNNKGIFQGINITIENNTFYSNECGFSGSEGLNVTSNTFIKNRNIKCSGANPEFKLNKVEKTLITFSNFSTSSQEINLGDLVEFNVTLRYMNRTICPECQHNITLYPDGNLKYSKIGENITGNFTPARIGIYSLKINVSDSYDNSEIRKYNYYVNITGNKSIGYYFRKTKTSHGQGYSLDNPASNNFDTGSLLFEPPPGEENRTCYSWIQFSPDNIPFYPLGIFKEINYSIWYSSGGNENNWTGIQRYVDYQGLNNDYNTTAESTNFIKTFGNFGFIINWPLNYYYEWYWLGIKLRSYSSSFPAGIPTLYSSPENPSYANISYRYSTTPAIKSISNEDIDILAATMESENSRNASIILEGDGITELIIEMPDKTSGYAVSYSDIDCNNENCKLNSQLGGIINLTLNIFNQLEIIINKLESIPPPSPPSPSNGGSSGGDGGGSPSKISNKTIEADKTTAVENRTQEIQDKDKQMKAEELPQAQNQNYKWIISIVIAILIIIALIILLVLKKSRKKARKKRKRSRKV